MKALISLTILLMTLSTTAKERPLRIMPLGDSITAGYTDNPKWKHPFEFGYRSGLYKLLKKAGYNFKFVGASGEPYNKRFGDPTRGGKVAPTLDLRKLGQDGHRGYGGWNVNGIHKNVAKFMEEDKPDVILLLIGINGGANAPSIEKLVSTIFETDPKTKLIVAQITSKAGYVKGLHEYNTYIREKLVPNWTKKGFAISTVDLYSHFLFDPKNQKSIDKTRLSNRINHPTNEMYDKMAQSWFEGIDALKLPKAGIAAKATVETTSDVPKHRFIASTYGSGKVFIVGRDGKVEWEHPAQAGMDAFMLEGDRVLFTDKHSMQIVDLDHKVLMKYQTKGEIHSVTALKNGNFLLALSGEKKIVEIDATGQRVKETLIASKEKNGHLVFRDVDPTPEGTYLVALWGDGAVVEYQDGKLIRRIDATVCDKMPKKAVHDVERLKNGNTLIATGYGKNIIELDKDNKVVWELKNGDIDGLKIAYTVGANRLPNGNTLITFYKGNYNFIEVTPDKKIVWGVKAGAIKGLKGPTSIQYLD